MHAILTAHVPPPSFFRPDIPSTFDSLVLRAMKREPSERFASARELGHALAPFSARSLSPPKRISAPPMETGLPAIPAAAEMGFQLIRVANLDLEIWLHTDNEPKPSEWTRACRVVTDFVGAKNGDVSSHRRFVVSDGGAPSAMQRKVLFQDAVQGRPVPTAVVTTILRRDPVKRGIATAIRWLNPEFRIFEPHEILLALDHIGVSLALCDSLWTALTEMQRALPANGTLRLVAEELALPLCQQEPRLHRPTSPATNFASPSSRPSTE
jgi:hypothetical protein